MTSTYYLSRGKHDKAADGRCAMEWVSYLAGEPHSDHPECVSPVLANFCIRFNDRLGDADRQKLRPYLARTIGTRGDGLDAERVQMCREFLVRHALPLYLDAAGRVEAAARLRALPETLTVKATLDALSFARAEARDARDNARERLAARIRSELGKRDAAVAAAADAVADVAAIAVADADVAAVAVAVAAVAAAVGADAAADVAADVAAVAVAAADVAAVAAADVAADVAAVAVAAADVAAVAAVGAGSKYWSVRAPVRDALYDRMRAGAREFVAVTNGQLTPMAFDLLDRMLPLEAISLPVVEDAGLVCAAP